MNKAILIGRLGQEVETISASNGNISKFSLATDESYKDKNGQKVEKTEWHNIVVFGKLADVVSQYFKKGMRVMIEGKIKTDTYEVEGVKKYSTNIVLSNFEFLSDSQTVNTNNGFDQDNSF